MKNLSLISFAITLTTAYLPAQTPEFEFLFSIPYEPGRSYVLSGLTETDHGYFFHTSSQIYFADTLPTQFSDLEQLPLPEDAGLLWHTPMKLGNSVYFRVAPEDENSEQPDYLFRSRPDGTGTLIDVTADQELLARLFFYDPETDRYTLPSQVLPYGDSWLVAPNTQLALYQYHPTTDSLSHVTGSEMANSVRSGWDMAIAGNVVLTGGPSIDQYTYYLRAELDEDGSKLTQAFELVRSTPGQNKFPRDIHGNNRTKTFFAGDSSGILRSTEGGRNLHYVEIYNEDHTSEDPSINCIETNQRYPRQVVAAGVHQTSDDPFFGFSLDNGESWENLGSTISEYGESGVFVEEVSDGVFYLGVSRPEDQTLNILRVTLPDFIADTFPEAQYIENGWWSEPSLGWFDASLFPWIWSEEQGQWFWLEHTGDNGGWTWDPELEWIWLHKATFPWIYCQSTEGWLYYKANTRHPRWFYDTVMQDWREVE